MDKPVRDCGGCARGDCQTKNTPYGVFFVWFGKITLVRSAKLLTSMLLLPNTSTILAIWLDFTIGGKIEVSTPRRGR
jgi:hypothetical protein